MAVIPLNIKHMSDIDHLFKNSETQKNIALSEGAWNRLNDMLDQDRSNYKARRFRFMSIAASLVILIAIGLFWSDQLGPKAYKLVDLTVDQTEGIYNAEDIAFLSYSYNLPVYQAKFMETGLNMTPALEIQ
jgi:hypothetical protein